MSYLAVAEFGYKGTEVGALFGWTRSGTSKAVERGRQALCENPSLAKAILGDLPASPSLTVEGRLGQGAYGEE